LGTIKIINKIDSYTIVSATIEELESILKNNALLILPIIKEAKTIINPDLLKKYREYQFTKKNTKQFIDSSIKVLQLNKKGLELDFEIGSLVYSLILRIRGLLMIKLIMSNNLYSKLSLFNYLESNNLPKNKIEELHGIYSSERNDIKVQKSSIIRGTDIRKLLAIAEKLLKEVKALLT